MFKSKAEITLQGIISPVAAMYEALLEFNEAAQLKAQSMRIQAEVLQAQAAALVEEGAKAYRVAAQLSEVLDA